MPPGLGGLASGGTRVGLGRVGSGWDWRWALDHAGGRPSPILPLVGASLLAVRKPGAQSDPGGSTSRGGGGLWPRVNGVGGRPRPRHLNKARYVWIPGLGRVSKPGSFCPPTVTAAVRPSLPSASSSPAGRRLAYEVSPASASSNLFEGRSARRPICCRIYPMRGEIFGGWFIHALREAVAAADMPERPGRPWAFYDRVGRESACAAAWDVFLAAAPRPMNCSGIGAMPVA